MSENILMKYMEHRYHKRLHQPEQETKEPGPVITISRETGCPAKKIARLLIEKLNIIPIGHAHQHVPWRCVTKEILCEAAKELNMKPEEIKYVFDYETRSTWDDLFSSFSSKYYKSDRKIRKTIAEVIRTIGEQGHVIIVGRGSVAITKDIPKSLHINLEAPLEWRIDMISQKYEMTPEQAKKFIMNIDKKRENFRNLFYGKNTDYTRFDITFDCMSFSIDEIADIILQSMKIRKLTI